MRVILYIAFKTLILAGGKTLEYAFVVAQKSVYNSYLISEII